MEAQRWACTQLHVVGTEAQWERAPEGARWDGYGRKKGTPAIGRPFWSVPEIKWYFGLVFRGRVVSSSRIPRTPTHTM